MPTPPHLTRITALLLVLLQLAACAPQAVPSARSPSAMSESLRSRLGTVAVVQVVHPPKQATDVGVRGRSSGAAKGALAGAGAGAVLLLSDFDCRGDMCGAALILALPIFILTGALIGGVIGGVQATPADKASQVDIALIEAVDAMGGNRGLRAEVIDAAKRAGVADVRDASVPSMKDGQPDYTALAAEGIDTVLEVELVGVALGGGGGSDPELKLGAQAAIRLVDAKTNTELFHNLNLQSVSQPKRFSAWNMNDRLALKQELETIYRNLAVRIVDEVFLVVRSN